MPTKKQAIAKTGGDLTIDHEIQIRCTPPVRKRIYASMPTINRTVTRHWNQETNSDISSVNFPPTTYLLANTMDMEAVQYPATTAVTFHTSMAILFLQNKNTRALALETGTHLIVRTHQYHKSMKSYLLYLACA